MTFLQRPPHARRRRFIAPLAVGLGLIAAGCASTDPYAESVARGDGEREMSREEPNAAAAAALLRVAGATRAAGDYASAINVLKRAHRFAPADAEILIELGESLAAVRAYNEAREVLARAVDLAPRNTRALRGLANALVALSEPALALSRYHQALDARKEAATYNGLGVALDILNDPKGAAEAYRAGLALEPRNLSLVGNAALSAALQDDRTRAIDLIAAELRAGNSTPRLRQNLALVYGLEGRFDDARALLRIDLDEGSVRNNIAYYEMLRGLSPVSRRDTVLGRRSVVIAGNVAGPPPAPEAAAKSGDGASKGATEKRAAPADDTPARLAPQPRPDVRPATEPAAD